MSNTVIVTNNTISSCTPVNLELTCDENGGVVQYHLGLSDDATVLRRNGINVIKNATLTIDLPAYIGCNKVDFCNSAHFIGGGSAAPKSTDAVGTLRDIELSGVPGATVSFNPAQGIVQCDPDGYAYSIHWDFTSGAYAPTGINLDSFVGCNMALEFGGTRENRRLTQDNGFPLCGGLEEQCSTLCGRLTLCGRRV